MSLSPASSRSRLLSRLRGVQGLAGGSAFWALSALSAARARTGETGRDALELLRARRKEETEAELTGEARGGQGEHCLVAWSARRTRRA